MAIVFALLAAGANALATVLQRIGVEEASAPGEIGRSLMTRLLHHPIWFAGLALTTASFLLQAVALSLGDLSTVQPVMVTEIVFLLVLLATWFRHTLGWREWAGAVGTAAGLGVFLALASSRAGGERPSALDWLLLVVAASVAVIATVGGAQRGSSSWRAACYGCGAGVCFALTAACIKDVADNWPRGVVYVATHPQAYGVAATGLLGLVLAQHALQVGPIAASQSALLIVNPLSSILMGIWLFGDRVQAAGVRGYFEAFSLVVMFISLFVLSHSPLVAPTSPPHQLSDGRQPLEGVHTERWSG